jgi:NADH-quinone oxidoreductase subunit L
MNIGSILWLVPVLPALGSLINGLRAAADAKHQKSKALTNLVALGSTALSAIIATFLVVIPYIRSGAEEPLRVVYYDWIPAGLGSVGAFLTNFDVQVGFQIDPLSCTMLMVVAWIGFFIHVYSIGYMAHEWGYTRFFCYMNLFMFMMLLLVLGSNYVVMFVGWEGVGLCSYLLIGFYYEKDFAAQAGKKAFIVNRIGDFGFILGLFLIFNTFGSSEFGTVFSMAAAHGHQYAGVATAICLLLFLGACGKSAQIPLYVWLPDAMAGPTPVSALIHAATMVTAGVYMVVRSNVLFRLSPTAMVVVAVVGACTALFAATIGIAQNDIKKVLAYSTVSQLGFMFMAAGVGAFTAAIFHLMTHAFFKACLFLGSGSVIHGCGGEQDMRRMGGLRRYMPQTWITFLIATITIAGIPPLAGFFSKDEILGAAAVSLPFAWVLGVIAAIFTAFYMFRLYFMTFEGQYRGAPGGVVAEPEPEHPSHALSADTLPSAPDAGLAHGVHDEHGAPHESPASMTMILMILAFLSAIGGFIGFPWAAFGQERHTAFQSWLHPILLPIEGRAYAFPHAGSLVLEWALIILSVAVAVAGIAIAWRFYFSDKSWSIPNRLAERFPLAYRIIENKYYVDEIYGATVVGGTLVLSRLLSWFDANIVDGLVNLTRHITVFVLGHGSSTFDQYVIDGAVNGLAWSAKRSSTLLRRMQSGLVQNYALIMGGGIVLLTIVYLFLKP